MADRLSVITHLKLLAEAAAQRGDDRAAAALDDAAQMLYEDGAKALALEHRRRSDADRQDRLRESRRSRDVTLRNVTNVTPPGFSPTPPFPSPLESKTTTTDARLLAADSVENLMDMLAARLGDDLWTDVDGFIRRREFVTWKAWIKEMLSILTGGKAMPCDLAQVCRDDGALKREIGSPKGLRTFVASAVAERTNPTAPPHSNGSNGYNGARRGGVAQRTFDNGRKALDGLP